MVYDYCALINYLDPERSNVWLGNVPQNAMNLLCTACPSGKSQTHYHYQHVLRVCKDMDIIQYNGSELTEACIWLLTMI